MLRIPCRVVGAAGRHPPIRKIRFIFQVAARAPTAPAGLRRHPPPRAHRRRPCAGCSSQPTPLDHPRGAGPLLPAPVASCRRGAGAGAGVGAVPAHGPAVPHRLRLAGSSLPPAAVSGAGCDRLCCCSPAEAGGPGSSPCHPQWGHPPHLQAVAPEVPAAALWREEGRAAGCWVSQWEWPWGHRSAWHHQGECGGTALEWPLGCQSGKDGSVLPRRNKCMYSYMVLLGW